MKFSVFQISRRGGRENNEDRMGYCYTHASALFVLADGMGGHPQGEVAAQIAVQTVSSMFKKQANPVLLQPDDFLKTALLSAHHQILDYALKQEMTDTPRTTLVVAVAQQGYVRWIHCGDSRLYMVRDGELFARTSDHSYQEVQRRHPTAMIDMDTISRHALFTCLGSHTRPVYDVQQPIALEQGDRILLCSDGLWGALDDTAIVRGLGRQSLAQAVSQLVDDALLTAGPHSDNVTAVAMEWEVPNADESLQDVSTGDIDETLFESTIQRQSIEGLSDDVDELDEEAIERSIAEINAAIRRSAQKNRLQ